MGYPRSLPAMVSIVVFTGCKNGIDLGPSVINPRQQLRVTVGNRLLTAGLYDNVTARDFVALLPTTVTLDDYAATEKIVYPSSKLSTNERNAVSDPTIGDITVYALWGNVAFSITAATGMTQIAIQESLNGKQVEWLEKSIK